MMPGFTSAASDAFQRGFTELENAEAKGEERAGDRWGLIKDV
jgi:hypothetical protein